MTPDHYTTIGPQEVTALGEVQGRGRLASCALRARRTHQQWSCIMSSMTTRSPSCLSFERDLGLGRR